MPNAILDPTGSVKSKVATAAAPRARRPASLNGARVGLLINTKQNARPFLEEVGRPGRIPGSVHVPIEALREYSVAIKGPNGRLLVDLVPNHMGIARNRNAWWRDVLENGSRSRYSHVFDIDWRPAKPELAGRFCCRSSVTSMASCSSAVSCASS